MRTATIALACVCAGCAADDAAREHATRTDSAGVAITTNSAAALEAAAQWRLADAPSLDIGIAEGDTLYQLFRVRDAVTLSTGDVALINNREIRVYDAAGTFVRRFGRAGEGPGEMRAPGGLFRLAGDTIALWDEALRRITFFAPDGTVARIVHISGPSANPELLTILDDGSFIITDSRLVIPASGFEPTWSTLVRYDARGALLDSLPRQPYALMGRIGPENASAVGSPHFSPRTWISANDVAYWVATGTPEVTMHDASGDIVRSVRWDPGDLSITAEDRDAYRAAQLEGVPPDIRPLILSRLDGTPFAERMPATRRTFPDAAGRLWVERFPRPTESEDAPTQWIVFDRDGALIARIDLPPTLYVFEAGDDYVLGVERDELDIEHLRRYGWGGGEAEKL